MNFNNVLSATNSLSLLTRMVFFPYQRLLFSNNPFHNNRICMENVQNHSFYNNYHNHHYNITTSYHTKSMENVHHSRNNSF